MVFYDAQGMVAGIGKTYAEDGSDDRVAPGQTAPFHLGFVVLSGEPASYYAFAEAKIFR